MRIEIVLEEAEPLTGQVSADGRPPVAFVGWLGLLAILDQITSSLKPSTQDLGDELDA